MNKDQRVAFINSQSVCATAKIEAMKSENMKRESLGDSMAYTEKDFMSVPTEFGLDHNTVIDFLRD